MKGKADLFNRQEKTIKKCQVKSGQDRNNIWDVGIRILLKSSTYRAQWEFATNYNFYIPISFWKTANLKANVRIPFTNN